MSVGNEIELPLSVADLRSEQAHRLNDHAMAQHEAGLPAETVLAMLRRALALMPNAPAILSNIGLALWHQGALEPAYEAFRKAVALAPESYIYHANLGVFASTNGDAETAYHHLDEAVRLAPDKLGPKWDRALLKLWTGNWKDGLADYDIRRVHKGPSLYPGLPVPLWQGEDLTGKSLYIQGEQGVGDRILFSRYIAWVKERWPTCRISCCLNDGLVNLLWEFRAIVEFLPEGIPWPKEAFDYGCFVAGLMEHHGSTPDNIPPDPGFIKQRLDKQHKAYVPEPNLASVKVGICWTGNPKQNRNIERSIPLEQLLTLAEDPRLTIYSIQASPGSADITRLGCGEVIMDLGTGMEAEGWVGAGLVLRELDVVVTVCTSIAHLAGALGLNCWTLLCRDPYWIWPREGDTTLWYPNMRLFRQKDPGNWRDVISQVKLELAALADAKVGQL